MRFASLSLSLVLTLGAVLPAAAQGRRGPAMTPTTTAFPDGGPIPVRFTQAAEGVPRGGGTSPALSWANAPDGTRSFLLHMHDMEVARGGTTEDQAHWVVWHIPASATGLPEGVPSASQLTPCSTFSRRKTLSRRDGR